MVFQLSGLRSESYNSESRGVTLASVTGKDGRSTLCATVLAPVVQKVDSTIRWINVYPVDSEIGFPNTYPLDSDFSGGQCYPAFEQLGPGSLGMLPSDYNLHCKSILQVSC